MQQNHQQQNPIPLNFFRRQKSRPIIAEQSKDSLLLESIKVLNNSIKELSQVTSARIQSISTANFPYVDERFESIKVQIPNILHAGKEQRKLLIEQFLGKICKKIFSIGFSELRQEAMDQKRVKVFCSQKLLQLIIKLIKKNQMDATEVKIINDCLRKKLLPYFQAKYPLSEETANSNLSNLIVPKNNIEDEENDLMFRSGVNFELKQSKDYSSQIMRFFNFLIDESNKKKDGFNSEIQQLFKKIYDQHQTIEMLKFDPKKTDSKENIIQAVLNNALQQQKLKKIQQKDVIKEKKRTDQEEEEKRKAIQYRQKVQAFSSYRIGKKLPENLKMFSNKDIAEGNFQLTDPALIRIATKWCEELEKYYDEETILNRERPYRMKDKTLKFLDKKWMTLILSGLLKKYYHEYPFAYLKQVNQHSNMSQSEYGGLQIPKQLNVYSEEEAIVGNFSILMFQNCENYLKGYLNSLIHGIMLAMQVFEKIVNLQKEVNDLIQNYVQKRTDQNMKSLIESVKNQFSPGNNDYRIPSLITFKIGDLLRCKCSSKEDQIKALYCQISRISSQTPQYLEIVRVKNRLDKGTKDILINMLYKESIVIQMQLAVNADKSKFIQSSNAFCHYLYELQRAQFGPINEMCSIWTSKDQRALFFRDQFNKRNKRRPKQAKRGECYHKQCRPLSLPFKCSSCYYYYLDCHQSQNHVRCQNCNDKICFLCFFDSMEIQEKKKSLNIEKGNGQKMNFIYYQGQNEENLLQSIPNQCCMINIRDSKKREKKIVKYDDGRKTLLLEAKDNNRFGLILQIDHKKQALKKKTGIQKFFMKSIIIDYCQQQEQNLSQKIKKNYILPEYLQSCFKAEKNSFNIVAQQFQCQTLKEEGQIKHRLFVQKVNLSQNGISDPQEIKIINAAFPKVKQLNLNYNRLMTLPENIGQLKKIESLNIINNRVSFLPETFGNMQNLKFFKICENKLSSLPESFGNLTALTSIDIFSNQLISLPESFKSLTALKTLDLRNNQITCLPKQFGSLTALTILNIQNNQLVQLPESFGDLSSLQKLDLSYNQLTYLPQNFGMLKALKNLDVENNKLTQLPESFGSLAVLTDLNIYKNRLTYLCESFGKLTVLTDLNIYSNNLNQLPQSFGQLTSLTRLQISENKLSSLPKSFGNLGTLTEIHIYNNQLYSLPETFGSLKNLKKLEIRNNKLDTLPKSFGDLVNLISLNIYNNMLTSLPESFGRLSSLTTLNIYNGQLTQLPESFGNLTSLNTLYIQNNHLKKLPDSFGKLKFLKTINISENSLIKLPQSFGKLASLKTLDLRSNLLRQLPQSFGSLTGLVTLDIQNNQLVSLPQSFGSLSALTLLNIYNNQLPTLPQSFGNLVSLAKLYISNNELTQLPQQFGNLASLDTLDIIQNYLTQLPESFGCLKSLKVFDMRKNQLQQLPETFGHLTTLTKLDIQYNQIKSLPQSFGFLISLTTLNASNNELKFLPQSFGHMTLLRTLYMHNNQLSSLPQSFGNLAALNQLDLSNNLLPQLPQSFANLAALSTLNLSKNRLELLPPNFGDLINLITLNIYNNKLTSLPVNCGNLINLTVLKIHNNKLSSLPESFSQLKHLKILNIRNNQLKKLPEQFGNLKYLTILNIYKNQLSMLPRSFGDLDALATLDIQNNKLTQLPKSFSNLAVLSTLYISDNKLTQLHQSLSNLTALCKLYISDNCLEYLPQSFNKLAALQTLDIRNNKLTEQHDLEGKIKSLKVLRINYGNKKEGSENSN